MADEIAPPDAPTHEISADLLLAAAGASLFAEGPQVGDASAPPRFAPRAHAIRFARESDLPALVDLDARCWPPGLHTPAETLRKRLLRNPCGQFVVDLDGAVVGVIYFQPIADSSTLDGVTMHDVDALFNEGGAITQLLAINVAPDVQHRGLGDELLEFTLSFLGLQPHVAQVVAVTRCKDYDGARDYADYVVARDADGGAADPVLRFHEAHGACVVKPMPGYRPQDDANAGHGVLVRYDIRRRARRPAPNGRVLAPADVLGATEAAIRDRLGAARASAYAADRPLMEMGLDSADLLALGETLANRFGFTLPASFFFLNPTPAKIARALDNAPRGAATTMAKDTDAGDALAIVSMACRLPGRIDTPAAFWRLLESGGCVVSDAPPGRWRWPEGIDPEGAHAGIARGGFLEDVDAFDAPFFRISAAEAQSMDPQQRLLLELGWELFERAGLRPSALAGSDTGVFIGASGSDYARLIEQSGAPIEAHFGAGGAVSVIASRLSYFFDLTGPSLVVDTACSASLVALCEAARALRAGECARAIVGGVNLMLHPATSVAYHKAGMLSRDGLCRAFDADARGYVRGEGAVLMLLQPLAAARAAGARIHAVIRGTARNHGGQASGLTAPHPGGQARLLRAAWADAGVDPASISYIEAHGTGTALGDPVEAAGVARAFEEAGAAPAVCGLGSVKTNLGHLEAAAGLAGVMKTALALERRTLPASLHFETLNPKIAANGVLRVIDRLTPWTGDAPRRAGVSSFGSGGANAHVVLEEHDVVQVAPEADRGPVLFLLSARTTDALRAYARRYIDWLAGEGRAAPLQAIARAAAETREPMAARLALVAADRTALIEGLTRFAQTGAPPPCDGDDARARRARRWLAGEDVSLEEAPESPAARVDLPCYPFERRRYWLPGAPEQAQEPTQESGRAMFFAPLWRPIAAPLEEAEAQEDAGARVVIVNGAAHLDALKARWPRARALDAKASVDAREIDHLIWIAPTQEAAPQSGLLGLFGLTQSLLSQGDSPVAITAVTFRTQAVARSDAPTPAHAGVHGFLGAFAKEQPRWRVRALDLDSADDLLPALLALPPAQAGGETLARRNGQWLARIFAPTQLATGARAPLAEGASAFRQNGVYLIVGGAGGVGAALTRHIAERYQAQAIWIGRRPLDAQIMQRIDEIAALGPTPVYVEADAADAGSLAAALAQIHAAFPVLHGAILSTVGAFDKSVAEMDEAQFRDVLSAKIDASVNLVAALDDAPLDFLLFFSSVVALEKTGGLSGYAAGGAFVDALAMRLAQQPGRCVKTIDWGHWDIGAGAAISQAAKRRNANSGRPPLAAAEAIAALETALLLPLPQICVAKIARPDALPFVDPQAALVLDPAPASSCLDRLSGAVRAAEARAESLAPLSLFNNAALDAQIAPLLASLLRAVDAPPQGFYPEWRAATRRFLADAPAVALPLAWAKWESAKTQELAAPDLAAAVALADACLQALPDILAGRTRATEVIFPDASMRRVEGVYRDNAVADYFNDLLADALVSAIEARLADDPGARLRLLEIGAGTGGTTARLLPRLAPYATNIEEYAYTDLSKAFLFHAEEQFARDCAFLRPRLFDVEKPVEGQLRPRSYDIAVATNVLHATRDIRATLQNAKAALRGGGLLMLNELATPSLFAHVTFGLLEGWWRATDMALRMPGSPGLSAAAWRDVLRQEGFPAVVFPAPGAHALGQQIVVAQSDGLTRTAPVAARPKKAAPATATTPVDRRAPAAPVADLVARVVARALRMPEAEIDRRAQLGDYGLDSILVSQITAALREDFPQVTSTLLFEAQTVEAIAGALIRDCPADAQRLAGALASETPATLSAPARASMGKTPTPSDDRVAIIGMSCRFPQADGPDAYWELLASGRDAVTEIPRERWDDAAWHHPDPEEAALLGKSYCKWGAFIEGATEFDPLFFNIAPREAAILDPQERLFLQATWQALEDAGYTPRGIAKDFAGALGVFAGVTRTGFDLFGPPLWAGGDPTYPHTSFSSVANRVSFFLDARGPSVPVDTMCSSSLTAVHQACRSLADGACRLALAGGVNVYLHPTSYVGLSAARMLSRDGVCRSFGKGANGFVPGEGVAALLLKPLAEAIADGDRIHAVIRATHVNHGGRTNGYSVPNPLAQADLVREALLKADVDARDIGYIEAHGTGTELGDPIEIAGLSRAFQHFTADVGFCAIGSAKSVIGHLEAAAGVAGLIKAVLQMQRGQFAPTLHAEEINPEIDFARTPFVLQRTRADWPRADGAPRLSCVSSFGAGGANAHAVLEEHIEPPRPAPRPEAALILLSARDAERLTAYAGKLARFIAARGDGLALDDLAFTLQAGREPMAQRLAFVARTLDEARARFDAVASGADMSGAHIANIKAHRDEMGPYTDGARAAETAARLFAAGRLDEIGALWVKGLDVDWRALHAARDTPRPPRLTGLPTYPFLTRRLFLPDPKPAQPVPVIGPQETPRETPHSPAPLARPAPVALRETGAFAAPATPLRARPIVALASLATPDERSLPAELALMDHGGGVLSLRLDAREGARGPLDAALAAAFERARGAGALIVEHPVALGTAAPDAFGATVAGCPAPVIAVLDAADEGAVGRRAGSLCDLAIEGAEAALALARDITRSDAAALAELKALLHATRRDALDAPPLALPAVEAAPRLTRRRLFETATVMLEASADGVVLLRLHDRASKNTSSPQLVAGLVEAFAEIARNADLKVVVITGFDAYFACGGTREGLLAIQSGAARFTDEQSYALPLLCELPVIAAMQGHAIGAGWALGLFCDAAIYSEESVYRSPYMLYGFTPGAGSTAIFPARLGALGAEALFSARDYRGRDLAARGIGAPVLPRAQTLDAALAQAHALARRPRAELVAQKAARASALRARLAAVFARELDAHDRTFVANPAVLSKIARHFHDVDAVTPPPATHPPPQDAEVARRWLRETLAAELGMQPQELDADAAFVDLGMDSISAVTFARKLNARFGLALPATLVYRYPTLPAFADAVVAHLRPAPAPHHGDLAAWLRESLARELLISTEALDAAAPFVELGLDSITAVTWVRAVNARCGLDIAATSVYRHPTLAAFVDHVAALMAANATPATGEETPAEPVLPAAPVEIARFALPQAAPDAAPDLAPFAAPEPAPVAMAIVGMAGAFPKAADVRAFWRNILGGVDCTREIDRWPLETYHDPDRKAPGKTVCGRMGALDGVDLFDPLFFGISPADAELMDPQQRLFLMTCWRAIEDAGHDPISLSGGRVGVFAGCAASDYATLMGAQAGTAQALIGDSVAMLPARVSYFLNLTGPCLAIDTACSASLVALAAACDSLASGASDIALAGGVYVINGPDIQVKMSQAGMLSPDGRCYSFDARANGFAPGEGVGALMLKRLADARRDGDDIIAVVRGWGVNQDGRSNGITAPSQQAQTQLETDVYTRFSIDPADIGLVEAHGTGTALGDPIEAEALTDAFRRFTTREDYCALGSVKSNIGHAATAAGVAGVIKAALALEAKLLPPSINFETLNPHIRLAGSPFFVNTATAPWPAPQEGPRLAAVSSFGFSGANAHVVLAEAPAPAETAETAGPVVFPLSARSDAELKRYATRVADHLGETQTPLGDLAATFQRGRVVFEHRLAIVAQTTEALRARLAAYGATGAADGVDVFDGKVLKGAAPAPETAEGPAALARAFVRGAAVDWARRGATGRRRRGLPTYPFALQRCWPTPAPQDPQQETCDGWRAEPLPQLVWSERLRERLGRPLALLCADAALEDAFLSLLSQVQRAAGLDLPPPACFSIDAAALVPPDADALVISGDAARLDTALAVLSGAGTERDIFVFGRATRAETARLGARAPGATLATQEETPDMGAAMQVALREWLAAVPGAGRRVHHDASGRHVKALAKPRATPASAPLPGDAFLIRKEWTPAPPSPTAAPARRGALALLANAATLPLARALADALSADFAETTVAAEAPTAVDVRSFAAIAQARGLTHVVDLCDLHAAAAQVDMPRLALFQALAGAGEELHIRHVTAGLQTFRCASPRLAGATTAGLVRMLRAEYPHIDAATLDLDACPDLAAGGDIARLLRCLRTEFEAAPGATEICWRNGDRFAPRLVSAPAAPASPPAIDPDGVYVISGGLRGIGLEIARHLARRGARRLALLGAAPLPPRESWRARAHDDADPMLRAKLAALVALEDAVDHLAIHCGPIDDAPALVAFFAGLRGLGRVRGVVHAAGAYSDAALPGFVAKTREGMGKVFAPKIAGLLALDQAIAADALDFFVTPASMAALIPALARGAADYAAASAFACFLAEHRQAQGRRGYKALVSPDWNETGALARLGSEARAAVEAAFARIGLRSFPTPEGCALFDLALTQDAAGVGVGDHARFNACADDNATLGTAADGGHSKPVRSLLETWESEKQAGRSISVERICEEIGPDEIGGLDPALVERLYRLMFDAPPPGDLAGVIAETVRETLKLPDVDPTQSFQSYGLDSISAMVLSTRLERKLQRSVQPQWLIESCTVEALARRLASA